MRKDTKTISLRGLAAKAAAAVLGMTTMMAAFAVPEEGLPLGEFWAALIATKAVMLASGFALYKIINPNRKIYDND